MHILLKIPLLEAKPNSNKIMGDECFFILFVGLFIYLILVAVL
jgi:hypothetical protein